MMLAVERLGYYSRSWKNAIASIIYNVHLLCDIQSAASPSVRMAVAGTDRILNELEVAFRELFNRDHVTAQSVIQGLRAARADATSESARAETMLTFLKSSVPHALRTGQEGVHYRIMQKHGVTLEPR